MLLYDHSISCFLCPHSPIITSPVLFVFDDSFLLFLCASQAEERRRGGGHTESNGFGNHGNIGNLPDLLQQSNSPSATPTTTLQELGSITEVSTHAVESKSLGILDVMCICRLLLMTFSLPLTVWCGRVQSILHPIC